MSRIIKILSVLFLLAIAACEVKRPEHILPPERIKRLVSVSFPAFSVHTLPYGIGNLALTDNAVKLSAEMIYKVDYMGAKG